MVWLRRTRVRPLLPTLLERGPGQTYCNDMRISILARDGVLRAERDLFRMEVDPESGPGLPTRRLRAPRRGDESHTPEGRMKKLKLDVETLAVDSFRIAAS